MNRADPAGGGERKSALLRRCVINGATGPGCALRHGSYKFSSTHRRKNQEEKAVVVYPDSSRTATHCVIRNGVVCTDLAPPAVPASAVFARPSRRYPLRRRRRLNRPPLGPCEAVIKPSSEMKTGAICETIYKGETSLAEGRACVPRVCTSTLFGFWGETENPL